MQKNALTYCAGTTPAMEYAVRYLKNQGFPMVDHPTPDATHLLLDAPSFDPCGRLRSGQELQPLLDTLPEDITIIGGNLDVPVLSSYKKTDLLQDPQYIAENARITAYCAMKIALEHLPITLDEAEILVIGWGRIGKNLGRLLRACGANVTVAARKDTVRAVLQSLGYQSGTPEELAPDLGRFHVIFNTAPSAIYGEDQLKSCKILIDLASQKGLDSQQTVWARGLPGIHAPESSGKLIGQTILRLWKEAGQ